MVPSFASSVVSRETLGETLANEIMLLSFAFNLFLHCQGKGNVRNVFRGYRED